MKVKKKIIMGILAGTLCLGNAFPAMAGSWQSGLAGWWWQEDDGGYPVNAWRWIDGNQDGTAECYCFDDNGYCLMDTVTPDGYQVDSSGAWVVDGVVQRQTASWPQQNLSDSTAEKLCFIANEVFQIGGFYDRYDSEVNSMSVSVSAMSPTQKAGVLYGYQYCYSYDDSRITDAVGEDNHRALASDMKEIMGEIFGNVTDRDMKAFEAGCDRVEGDYYYMNCTGDYGDAPPYWLSADKAAVVENGQVKLSGNVSKYGDQEVGWVPDKQFEAYFVPQAGSCLDGYRFEQLIVR